MIPRSKHTAENSFQADMASGPSVDQLTTDLNVGNLAPRRAPHGLGESSQELLVVGVIFDDELDRLDRAGEGGEEGLAFG